MDSGVKIAISGKGGAGKTTLCAAWAELFARDGFDVLAIDADSNPNLSLALGVPFEESPQPLIEMKELIEERTGAQPGSVGQYFKLNPQVADLPEKYWLKIGKNGVKLLVLGGIQQAGGGCACPESVFLRGLIMNTILQRREVILVDLEAGVEFMGRSSVKGIDALVIVVEPGGRSIETARRIARMAQETGIERVAAVANRITDAGQVDIIRSRLKNILVIGSLSQCAALGRADLMGAAVLEADKGYIEEAEKARNCLLKTLLPSVLAGDDT